MVRVSPSTLLILSALQIGLSVAFSSISKSTEFYKCSHVSETTTKLASAVVNNYDVVQSMTTALSSILQNRFGSERKKEECESLLRALLDKCDKYGQVGSKCSESERAEVSQLARRLIPYSSPSPALVPLKGVHRLVHTHSKGGSSGALGMFVGKVTQEFVDDERFINAVEFGPLKISLYAERKALDKTRLRVSFKETVVRLGGVEVSRKTATGQGVWRNLFVGEYNDPKDGKRKLIRLIETPSLFVIEQNLS